MTTTATNLAIMHAVERRHRPFALALASLGAHALGDVPSPIAIGWVRAGRQHAMRRSSLSLARGGPSRATTTRTAVRESSRSGREPPPPASVLDAHSRDATHRHLSLDPRRARAALARRGARSRSLATAVARRRRRHPTKKGPPATRPAASHVWNDIRLTVRRVLLSETKQRVAPVPTLPLPSSLSGHR
jgi:hypothetical protein